MAKEAFYLVHADVDPAIVAEWNAWHAKEHVPLVVKTAGFLGATRLRHVTPAGDPVDPPRFTTLFRASGLGVVRGYLEGGDAGRMRAHQEAWLAGRKVRLTRETLEENYSVGSDGKPLSRTAAMVELRAAFVVRVRVAAELVPEWSTWYDGEHLPKVVAQGGFLRGGRWRVVEEAAGTLTFAVVYEASALSVVSAFRAGPGPALSKEHEAAFGGRVAIERELWAAGE